MERFKFFSRHSVAVLDVELEVGEFIVMAEMLSTLVSGNLKLKLVNFDVQIVQRGSSESGRTLSKLLLLG